MDWQTVVTALIVIGCAVYAAWKLMPAALRQRGRTAFGISAPASAGGCGGCDGCSSEPKPASGEHVVHIVRLPRDV
jgi:hypothetical protein